MKLGIIQQEKSKMRESFSSFFLIYEKDTFWTLGRKSKTRNEVEYTPFSRSWEIISVAE